MTNILAMGYLLSVIPILRESLSSDEYARLTPLATLVSKGDSRNRGSCSSDGGWWWWTEERSRRCGNGEDCSPNSWDFCKSRNCALVSCREIQGKCKIGEEEEEGGGDSPFPSSQSDLTSEIPNREKKTGRKERGKSGG